MAFIINDQQLARLIAPITPFYGTPNEWINIGDSELSTYSEIYRSQIAVRPVVDFIAGHAARMPIKLFHRINETDREHLRDHPLQKLLAWPSGYQGKGNFWRDAWEDMLVFDRVCFVKIRSQDTGEPVALVRIPAVWYTPYGQNYWHPDSIRILGNRGFGDFPIEDCVYIHGYDPTDPRIGVSPMQTLKSILTEEVAGSAWRRRFWETGAQPSMVITRPEDAPDWNDAARDRFITSLRAASNRGMPLLLEEGMTSNPSSAFNPKSSEYVGSKQFTIEQVLRAYNLPIGLFDAQQSAGNIGQFRAMLYAETLAPPITRFVDELEFQLLTDWENDPYAAGLYLEPMIEEKMRGNTFEQITMLVSATGGPILTRDEARAYLEKPSLADQGADELIVPMNVLVGGQASPMDATPNNPANQNGPAKPPTENEQPPKKAQDFKTADEHAAHLKFLKAKQQDFVQDAWDQLTKFFKRQRNAVAGGKGFARKRWDDELTKDLEDLAMKTATYFGSDAAERIGGVYDEARTVNYLHVNAELSAKNINDTTEESLKAEDADPAHIFDVAESSRAMQIATTRTTYAMNWGISETLRQNGG